MREVDVQGVQRLVEDEGVGGGAYLAVAGVVLGVVDAVDTQVGDGGGLADAGAGEGSGEERRCQAGAGERVSAVDRVEGRPGCLARWSVRFPSPLPYGGMSGSTLGEPSGATVTSGGLRSTAGEPLWRQQWCGAAVA